MAGLIRKTFTLSPGTIQQLDDIIAQSVAKDLHLTESVLVRLALAEGLPVVAEKLRIEEDGDVEQRTIETV